MKKLILAATLAAVSTSQAAALSCMKPDVAAAFKQASEAEQSYVVLKGKFAFTPPQKSEEPQAETVDAKFSGRLLTTAGFVQQVTAPVEIDMICVGEWCAQITPDTDYIAFVEQRGDSLVFEVGPCYGLAFQEPDLETTKRLENCAQGGACEALDG